LADQSQVAAVAAGAVAAGSFDWTGQNESRAAACEGDAGGPVFRTRGDQPELVGLHVAGGQGGCLAVPTTRYGGTAVRLDDLRTWITQNTPDLTDVFTTYHRSSSGIRCQPERAGKVSARSTSQICGVRQAG
jgi:secreted trypsin-like serine protease